MNTIRIDAETGMLIPSLSLDFPSVFNYLIDVKGFDMKTICSIANLNQSTVSGYMNLGRVPQLNVFLRLCESFQLDPISFIQDSAGVIQNMDNDFDRLKKEIVFTYPKKSKKLLKFLEDEELIPEKAMKREYSVTFMYNRILSLAMIRGLSLDGVVSLLGISKNTLYTYTNGYVDVTIAQFLAICEMVNCHPMCFIIDPKNVLTGNEHKDEIEDKKFAIALREVDRLKERVRALSEENRFYKRKASLLQREINLMKREMNSVVELANSEMSNQEKISLAAERMSEYLILSKNKK